MVSSVDGGSASDWVHTQAVQYAIAEVGAASLNCSTCVNQLRHHSNTKMLLVSRLIIGQERTVGGQLETASVWQEQEVAKTECYPVKHEVFLFLSTDTDCKSSQPFKDRFVRLCHVFNLNLEGVSSAPSCLAPVWLFGVKMTQNGAATANGTAKKGQVKELKIVIVGDGGCGKTSLLMVYAKGDFPEVRGASMSRNI